MRKITSHLTHVQDRQPSVTALGNVGVGGAEQDYEIGWTEGIQSVRTRIGFVALEREGITNEALLAVVADRLAGFQAGEFPSEYNQRALVHVGYALAALQERTLDRIMRGVENKATA